MPPCSPVALIVGFDPRTVLAIARSLHRRGIRVVVATIAAWEIPVRSRAIHRFVRLPESPDTPETFLHALLSTIETYAVDSIIPATDRALVALAPHDASLRSRVRVLGPKPKQTELILDKAAATRVAHRLGIPVPTTAEVRDLDALEPIMQRLRFPLIVKTKDKSSGCRFDSLPEHDVHCCADAAAVRDAIAHRPCSANLVLQERIPGDDVGLAVLMSGGDVLCSFQYRAQRLYPAEGGVCVLARSERVNTLFLSCAVRLLRQLEWEGVAQVDFRHDPHTGRFAFLEVNGRFWGSTAAAIRAGADFPWYAWQLGHDETPRCTAYRTGVSVRWLEGDLRRLLDMCSRRPRSGFRFLPDLLRFLADFRPAVRGMFWSWRDPIAGLDMTRRLILSWARARFPQGVRTPTADDAVGIGPVDLTTPVTVFSISPSKNASSPVYPPVNDIA